jgi:hypothetical protein
MKVIVIADDDNPHDLFALQRMLKVEDWVSVVENFDAELRRLIKYGEQSAEVKSVLDQLRGALHELLEERQLDIYQDR